MTAPPAHPAVDRYLELLKRSLMGLLVDEAYEPIKLSLRKRERLLARALERVAPEGAGIFVRQHRDDAARMEGRDWPAVGETMIGAARLDNLRACIEQVLHDDVPGDLIETGVWRGGATIFMRAVLTAYGDEARRVWVADSFAGLPPPNPDRFPEDEGDPHSTFDELAIPRHVVESNFRKYGLLDESVVFLEGWFAETLGSAEIDKLAVMRLDGDMYQSTIEALDALYPKLSVGGFCIVDDFGAVPACRKAVETFREAHGIQDPIESVDWTGVFWRRQS